VCPTGDHDANKMDGWLPRPGKAMAYMSGGEAAGYNFLTWELGASWEPGAGIVPDESSTPMYCTFHIFLSLLLESSKHTHWSRPNTTC